jgi:predicted nucleic acid-binding protein
MGLPSKQFALDTNILLDLVESESIAVRFHRTAQEKGFPLVVTFTVLRELGFAAQDDSDPGRKGLAHLALAKMNTWKITPIPKNGLFVDYAEDFSKMVRDQGLFPIHERNDGLILAEASLHGMSILITSDNHFFKHSHKLALAFTSSQLPRHVVPLRPSEATMFMARSSK